MKRTKLYQLALAALLLAGCAEEDHFGTAPVKGNHTIVATIEGQDIAPGARTAVDEQGNVTWIADDALGVFAAHTDNARFASTGSGASVTFKGDLSPADRSAERAYYPYDAGATLDNRTLTFNLPSEYTYTGTSNAPMIGVADSDGHFTFNHLCGLLRITLSGGMPADADRFVIRSAGDEAPALAGIAKVEDVTAPNARLALEAGGSHTITYRLGGLSATEGYQHFFVPLPCGEYPELRVAFYLKGKAEPEFTRTLSGLQVRRAVMTSLPVLDWKTGEQFVLGENTIEITDALAKHVSVSPEDNTTLLYKVTAADAVPAVGRVIWSRVTDSFPYGFLGKVTNVTANEDGSYTVETGVAALSEAFDELYVDEEVELVPEEGTARSRAEEMKVFGFNITTEADIKIGVEDEPIYAHGNIGLGYNFTASIILNKKQNVERASFSLAQASSLQFGLCLGGAFAAEHEREHSLGKLKFQRIPLAYGLIQLTPAIAPHFAVTASGEIQNEATFSSETVTFAGAEYKNGEWKAGQNKRNKANGESPWSFGGHLTFAGKVSAGLSSDCEVMLYERNDMKISLIPELAAKLTGEIRIDETNSSSLEKILNDIKLTRSFVFSGKIGIDASLLSPKNQLKAEIPLLEIEFAKKEIYLLPFFKELLASLKAKEAAEAAYLAQINTEANREMLSKDTRIAIEVKNQNDEVVQTTTPVAYTGSTENVIAEDNEEMAKTADPEPIEVEIDNIQAGEVYEAYPVIYSPLLEDIIPEGKLELKSQSVTFSAKTSLRDQLIQLYKDTDGDNWTNNDNWCSDKPIGEWYGIRDLEDGYRIVLSDNNLKGSIKLSDERITEIYVNKNDLTSIDLSNCTYLKKLWISNNDNLKTIIVANCTQLTDPSVLGVPTLLHLDAHGCTALSGDPGILNHNLEYVDLSDCNELVKDSHSWYNLPRLQTLKLRNCTQLTELSWNAKAPLDTLDVSGCINLKEIFPLTFSTPTSDQLKWVSLSGCVSLEKLFIGPPYQDPKYPIEYLDISNVCCPNANLGLSENLQVLKANGAEVQGLHLNLCTNLRQLEWDDIKVKILNISGWSITSLDMLAYPEEITELYIRNCPIQTFNAALYPALEKLDCAKTAITTLDLRGCNELSSLDCNYNEKLSSLNIEGCHKLAQLTCSGANLTSLLLNGCVSLTDLNCNSNQLTALDLQDCKNLEHLYCSSNQLTELRLGPCPNLTYLSCDNNQLTELRLGPCPNLTYLSCFYNQLTALRLNPCPNLTRLNCDGNMLTALQLDPCPNLTRLDCRSNTLTELRLEPCPNLTELDCRSNNLSELIFKDNTLLERVYCNGNQLKSLDVSTLTSLKDLSFTPDLLENIDISNTKITYFSVGNGSGNIIYPLQSVKVNNCQYLTNLYVSYTQISSLDISTCPNLEELDISSTLKLKSLIFPSTANKNLKEVYAYGSHVNCVIPDWFPIGDPTFKFSYERRYNLYRYKHDPATREDKLVYDDKGYGWWYPGEPNSGKHGR